MPLFADRLIDHSEMVALVQEAQAGRAAPPSPETLERMMRAATEDTFDLLRGLYYDTALSANPTVLSALQRLVPASRVLLGTDYPFAQEIGVRYSLDGLGAYEGFGEEERAMIYFGQPDRVAHTVFVDAFLPHDGKSMLDAFPEPLREDELRQIAENGAAGRPRTSPARRTGTACPSTRRGGWWSVWWTISGTHGLRTGPHEPVFGAAAGDLHRVHVRDLGRRGGHAGGAELYLPRPAYRPLADGVCSRRAGCAARQRRIRARPIITSQGDDRSQQGVGTLRRPLRANGRDLDCGQRALASHLSLAGAHRIGEAKSCPLTSSEVRNLTLPKSRA